jgi:hypothetical protein
VDDGGKLFLQVDPFRKAVGGHQYPGLLNGQFGDLGLALLVPHPAGYAGYLGGGSQVLPQVAGQVLRCGYVAAPEDGVKAFFEQPLHQLNGPRQLGVVLGALQVFS